MKTYSKKDFGIQKSVMEIQIWKSIQKGFQNVFLFEPPFI